MLRGTIRDHVMLPRHPFMRFFTYGENLSLKLLTDPLPEEVATANELLRVVCAMAGG
jgi:hypothetical protein